MEIMNVFQWPWQILQYTIDKWRIFGGPSGQDLYQDCNDVIRDFERAFTLENGWAVHDEEVVLRLQEAALGLKQWKNSIRWCATPDHKCFSEANNEKLVQLVLASLKKENSGLSETIGQHMSQVAKLLDFIKQLHIDERNVSRSRDEEEASRETKNQYVKRLDTALECLAIQLVPLTTYAELVFQPSHRIESIPIAASNTLQAMEARKRSSKPKDQQALAFLRSSSDSMPSSLNVRAKMPQEVAITQDLIPSSSLQVEANVEPVATPEETSGLHILFEPTTASSDILIDIVAVHGLEGDGYSTWTDEESGMLWLRDFLPVSPGFGNARVMNFGYGHPEWEAPVGIRAEQWLIKSAASLLSCIIRTRDETNTPKGKPIMFIGHSWGGIIIEMALKLVRRIASRDIFDAMKSNIFDATKSEILDATESEIFDATKSIIFFGTPHIGREQKVAEGVFKTPSATSQGQDSVLALQRIFEAAGVKQDAAFEASKYIGSMIANASESLPKFSRGLLVTSFYECEKYNGVLVVDENQARGNFAHETTIGLDANHHTICQFASERDKGFAKVHRAMYMHLIEIAKGLDAEEHPHTENEHATLDDIKATTEPLW